MNIGDFLSDIVSFLDSLNPIFFLLLACLLYGIFLFVRYQGIRALLVAFTLFCMAFLLLPAGQQSLQQVQKQPTVLEKGECLADATIHLAPFKKNEIKKLGSCDFKGFAFTRTSIDAEATKELVDTNTSYLVKKYGNPK